LGGSIPKILPLERYDLRMSRIVVLRLGHRIIRDQRLTTHVLLTARAYGADEGLVAGDRDDELLNGVRRVVENWGGEFKVNYVEDWKKVLRNWRERGGKIIHLTMYGINLPEIIDEVRSLWRSGRDLLIVVGGKKVPGELYSIADYNIAVTNQPHSEVAALATFLDWLQEGEELKRAFEGGRLKIIPQRRGKKVIRIRDR